MEYSVFKKEFKSYVLANDEWNIKEENYFLYEDGFTSEDEEELEFIRTTNIKYHRKETDILIGDFAVLKWKNNDITNVSRFDMKALYEDYQAGGWECIRQGVEANIKLIRMTGIDAIIEQLPDYETTKERLIIRPINYTNNRYELKEAIYKLHGDVALVLYVLLYDNKEMGLGTTKLSKDVFELWNREQQEVWDTALMNTYMMAPPRMYMNYQEATNPPYQRGAFMALNSNMTQISKLQVPTVTTTKQRNGAIAMFYPGVQERIAEMVGGDYYVAFTSVDDVRIHVAESISPRMVLQSLKDVNKKFNTKEDILSGKVFKYSRENGKLEALEM